MNPLYLAIIGWLLILINVFVFIKRLRFTEKKLDILLLAISVLNFFSGFFLLVIAESIQKTSNSITRHFDFELTNLTGFVLILSSIIICAFVALWAIFRVTQKKKQHK